MTTLMRRLVLVVAATVIYGLIGIWRALRGYAAAFFLVTEFPTPRKLGDRVAVVVIANAGHALIREQLVSVLAAWMKRVPG